MTHRKPHPDNALIDSMQDKTPAQQSRSGGALARDVGTRAELNRATDPEDMERVLGSDNPQRDEAKGDKTRSAIQRTRNRS